ncbi:MAG: flagellar biosynthetic protein FliP, partial [Synergistaceae bacterium]|nr:flagellar biosynthetic protein FliP [Synergistaceae bacterium]
MILLVLILHGVSSGAILNPPRPPELSGNIPLPSITLGLGQADSPRDVALTLQILALMTVLSLVPAILLMVTSFTRIIIVIGFVQRAIGLQQSPPQQVI